MKYESIILINWIFKRKLDSNILTNIVGISIRTKGNTVTCSFIPKVTRHSYFRPLCVSQHTKLCSPIKNINYYHRNMPLPYLYQLISSYVWLCVNWWKVKVRKFNDAFKWTNHRKKLNVWQRSVTNILVSVNFCGKSLYTQYVSSESVSSFICHRQVKGMLFYRKNKSIVLAGRMEFAAAWLR